MTANGRPLFAARTGFRRQLAPGKGEGEFTGKYLMLSFLSVFVKFSLNLFNSVALAATATL